MTQFPQPAGEAVRPSIALLIANEILGRGLEAVLNSLGSVGSVWRCPAGRTPPTLPSARRFDFVIVAACDAERLEELRAAVAGTGTRILLIVDTLTEADVLARTSAAADGFLSQQDLSAQVLADGLARAARGEVPMPPALARALLDRADPPAPVRGARSARLTDRETQALALLARGLTNQQIGRRLAISTHGAKRLVTSIMLKLDAPNRTAAVVNAMNAGLIEAP